MVAPSRLIAAGLTLAVVELASGCSTPHRAAAPPVFAPGHPGAYVGPGTVTESLSFERGLSSVESGEGFVVAGVRERPQPSWGALYQGRTPLPTSLAIRTPDGRELRWRPEGVPSMLAGYPTSLGVVVVRRVPRPMAECAPLVAGDCESWSLLLLDAEKATSRQLLAGSHAVPAELTPDVLVQSPRVLLTEARADERAASLLSIDLRTGDVRRLAGLPFRTATLSGSANGTVFAASSDPAAPEELASVDTATGRVIRLGRAAQATAGERALAWVEPAPGPTDGASRIRVRPFGSRAVTSFGVAGVEAYYARWASPTALLVVSALGLDLYTDALSAHPRRSPLGPRDWQFVPEVGVDAGGGSMSFGLVSPASGVEFFVVRL